MFEDQENRNAVTGLIIVLKIGVDMRSEKKILTSPGLRDNQRIHLINLLIHLKFFENTLRLKLSPYRRS